MTSWIILRTSGRNTLRLAESLKEDGYDVFAPVETPPPVSGYRRKGRQAMIPRYVFAHGDQVEDLLCLSHRQHRHARFTVLMIAGTDRIASVRESTIQDLRDAETIREALAVPRKKISPYSRGARVRVAKGIFSGMDGIVDRSDGREAEVWMTMFGRHKRFTLPLYALQCDEMKIAA